MAVALGQQLETFRCFDFSGGLDIATAPTKLARLGEKNRWLTKATNVVLDVDGSVRKRWGMRLTHEATETELQNVTVLGGYEFRVSSGTKQTIVATNTGVVYHLSQSTGLFTSIKTGLANTTRAYSFVTYNDILHVANGTDAPQQWDGTTWAALGGSSPATAAVLAAHGNRVFATATAVPSRLYWSKLNNSVDWSGTTDAGFLDVNPNDGGIILPLVPSIQELVILKENRPYRLQGIGPATGYTVTDNLVPTTGSTGGRSTRAGAFAANDVWYVSDVGVHRLATTTAFGDITESFVSERVAPYFGLALTTGFGPFVDTGSGYLATRRMILYSPADNQIIVAGRTGVATTYPNTLLIYDIGRQGWTVWTLPPNTEVAAMWNSDGTSTSPGGYLNLALHSTSTNDSWIVGMSLGTTSDADVGEALSDVDISAQIRHVSNLAAPGLEKTPRHLYLYFKKETSSTTMTLNLYGDFKTTAIYTTTFDITSSTAETQVVKRIDLPSGLACEYLEVDLTHATGGRSFTFYGYECLWRPRRRMRRAE